ncbi:Craniofacial development protein 2 [Merluccius polli]|uniref:Craniofacial development protein 2 n=1 Tax=Merluccius polli TaxID=89951 RepID=A0AA47MU83_MERPO|nr:Craniofacial development protein 2 [Merluccius polli]
MDNKASDRPERRTAIISRELKRFQIDIAALSVTRLADDGQLKEEKGGYTFFWKGKPANEPRIHGVGFAIKNSLINHLYELPVGINERLMTMRLMLASSQMATVISAYAPTLDAQDKEDKIILLGDFNARVGRNHHLWRGTLGKEGVGNTNSNGTLLLTKCSEHNLVIINTLFRQKNTFKTSWMHPRSKLWHLIDYVIVRTKDRCDVLNTRAMTSADDCWTDHRLIRSIMSIHLMRKRRMQKRKSRPKFNIERLGDPTYQQQLQAALSADLPKQYPTDAEKHWGRLSSTIINCSKSILGHKKRKHQDWYDENNTEIQQLLAIKQQTFITWQNNINCKFKRAAHAKAKAAAQLNIRRLKNQWWTKKALEIQQLADSGDTRGFFDATRVVYGPSYRCLTPLRSKDGLTLLKDKEAIANRWKEHYEDLLNRDTTPEMEALEKLPQQPINESMGEPPSLEEVQDAIRKMKNNKAAGPDGIPAEVLKEGGPDLLKHIHASQNMGTRENSCTT